MGSKYAGMTVNERLYESGLMDKFDSAVVAKDKTKIETILRKVELDDESINSIIANLQP